MKLIPVLLTADDWCQIDRLDDYYGNGIISHASYTKQMNAILDPPLRVKLWLRELPR
jgi:hypothetical protein